MSFEGTILNGTVVWDEPLALPEGTRVNLVVEAPDEAKPTFLGLMKFAGCMKNLPVDFAEEHNHYIHGTPRRKPVSE